MLERPFRKIATCAVRFHLVISITFFTARFAQGAEVAEKKYYFFSAERAEKK
jgi:hypothetical protein